MKHLKIYDGYKSGDYDYDYGGHVFVLARPKNGWDDMIGSMSTFKNNEFVPCMVSGHILNKYDKLQLWIIGNSKSYNINDFEIINNSDKGFIEMIKMFSHTNKYNI